MADTGLSRATVREALQLLEREGLITPRLGRYGGWAIRRPDLSVITRSIEGFIRGSRIRTADLLVTREAIEPSCAALAAERRTDADIAALEDLGDRMRAALRDESEFLRINLEWHLAVVAATHNEVLIGVMAALGEAIREGTEVADFHTLKLRRAVLHAHDVVLGAIRDRDIEAARRRMHRHVHAFRQQLQEHDARGRSPRTRRVDPSSAPRG
jgi:DNA-binding FadR family transcriptional regulator